MIIERINDNNSLSCIVHIGARLLRKVGLDLLHARLRSRLPQGLVLVLVLVLSLLLLNQSESPLPPTALSMQIIRSYFISLPQAVTVTAWRPTTRSGLVESVSSRLTLFDARNRKVKPLRASQSLSETSPCADHKAISLRGKALGGNRAKRIGSCARKRRRLSSGRSGRSTVVFFINSIRRIQIEGLNSNIYLFVVQFYVGHP